MEASAQESAEFVNKVKRTVYFDNLSPLVTEAVLRAALNQFVDVLKVEFIPNYINPLEIPQAALVEMRTTKQADEIIELLTDHPFMISGMPRPVRARAPEAGMFADRPRKPGKNITFRWLEPEDPDFVVAKKIEQLNRKHATESEFLLKHQLAEEEKLANQQAETLQSHYKKFELIDGVCADATAYRLAERYNIHIEDAWQGSS